MSKVCEEILQSARQKLQTVEELTKKFALSKSRIYGLLKEHGVPYIKAYKPLTKHDRNKDLMNDYKKGLSFYDLIEKYGITRQRIIQILQKTGYLKALKRHRTKQLVKDVLHYHKKGRTPYEIQLTTDISITRIRNILKKYKQKAKITNVGTLRIAAELFKGVHPKIIAQNLRTTTEVVGMVKLRLKQYGVIVEVPDLRYKGVK